MMLRSPFRDLLQGGLPHQSQLQRSYEKTHLCICPELIAGAQLRVLFVTAGTAWPVTPKELGWRRAAGQISDQEMMERLRSWPYTFSRLVVDAIDYGDWDDVIWLRNNSYISREEFGELKAITDPMQKRPDVL